MSPFYNEDVETEIPYPKFLSLEPLPPWVLTATDPYGIPVSGPGLEQSRGPQRLIFKVRKILPWQPNVHSQPEELEGRVGSSWTPEIVGVGREQEPPGMGLGIQKNSLIDFPFPWSLTLPPPIPTTFPNTEWQPCKRTSEHLLCYYAPGTVLRALYVNPAHSPILPILQRWK